MTRSTIRCFASLVVAFWLGGASGCDDDDEGGDTGAGTDGATSASGGSGQSAGNAGDDGNAGNAGNAGDVDNVAACDDLVAALECGGADLGQYVPCDSYAQLTCDLTDYFDCLEDGFTCNDGAFDPSGWTDCTSLAMCS